MKSFAEKEEPEEKRTIRIMGDFEEVALREEKAGLFVVEFD